MHRSRVRHDMTILFGLVRDIAVMNSRTLLEGWNLMAWELMLFGPILLVTVLVHELGHCLATRAIGGHVDHILLWPLGGLAFVGHGGGPCKDILVALAGPLTHIPLAAICLVVMAATDGGDVDWHLRSPNEDYFWENMVAAALVMQVALFCFNLLIPAYPLDGGRILVDVLFLCGASERMAAIISCAVSFPLALGLIAWGILTHQITMMLIAAWIIIQGLQIVVMIRNGTVGYHPMFQKDGAEAASGGGAAYAVDTTSSSYNANAGYSAGTGYIGSAGAPAGSGSGNVALPTFSSSSGVPPIVGRGKPLSYQENSV
eukprot:jgi/Mesvir1/16360/Mv18108-RA.1